MSKVKKAAKKEKAAKPAKVKKITNSEKIRQFHDAGLSIKEIVKKGYNRNTVIGVIWRYRIAKGEIKKPNFGAAYHTKKAKPAKKSAPKKKATTKKAKTKKPATKKKAVKKPATSKQEVMSEEITE